MQSQESRTADLHHAKSQFRRVLDGVFFWSARALLLIPESVASKTQMWKKYKTLIKPHKPIKITTVMSIYYLVSLASQLIFSNQLL